MSELHLEHWKHMGVLYKNPSCTCHLYEYDTHTYRVFCITQEQLQRSLISLCMDNDLPYSFYLGSFCLIQPYVEAVPLSTWLQESHTIQERISLCATCICVYAHSLAGTPFGSDAGYLQHRCYLNAGYRIISESQLFTSAASTTYNSNLYNLTAACKYPVTGERNPSHAMLSVSG